MCEGFPEAFQNSWKLLTRRFKKPNKPQAQEAKKTQQGTSETVKARNKDNPKSQKASMLNTKLDNFNP